MNDNRPPEFMLWRFFVFCTGRICAYWNVIREDIGHRGNDDATGLSKADFCVELSNYCIWKTADDGSLTDAGATRAHGGNLREYRRIMPKGRDIDEDVVIDEFSFLET